MLTIFAPMKKIVDTISKLTHMMSNMENAAKEEFNLSNLTFTQMNYLEAIFQLGNPNITELAAFIKLTKPTVKVSIDRLIEKEYVFKVQSDEDRRSSHLHLTKKGEQINEMHEYAHKCIAESISIKLTKEELIKLTELLNKVLTEK